MLGNLKSKALYKAFQLMNKRVYGANSLENFMVRQEEFLYEELTRQAGTYYGRLHGFNMIKS
ncbi:MAG: hypothetical protein ACFFBD_09465, partial [Candidatus Hodarchaeota archaeon]